VEAGVAIMLLNATNAMSTSVPGKLRNAIAAHSATLRMLVALARILRFACFDPPISQPKIMDPAIRQNIAASVLTPIRLVAFDCSKNVMSIHAAKNNRAEMNDTLPIQALSSGQRCSVNPIAPGKMM
jgi:hypothetical protein